MHPDPEPVWDKAFAEAAMVFGESAAALPCGSARCGLLLAILHCYVLPAIAGTPALTSAHQRSPAPNLQAEARPLPVASNLGIAATVMKSVP